MLKAALLKRYELTEEGFKRRYKKCRPDLGETFQQFTSRMKRYFTRWLGPINTQTGNYSANTYFIDMMMSWL